MDRNEIRKALLGSPVKLARTPITVNILGEDVAIEVLQPTWAQRKRIIDAGTQITVQDSKKPGEQADVKVHMDSLGTALLAVVELCVVPGTDERVFEKADLEALQERDAGGWLDELVTACTAAMNVRPSAKKTSATTMSGSSSSASQKPSEAAQ